MTLQPDRSLGHATLAACVMGLLLSPQHVLGQVSREPSFASRIEQLSESGGEFDTDNLISNEKSYLHVMPALGQARVSGGAYIGVGPDQNFSYIAQIRPHIAFIVDLRRDNLLLHLLFKALFGMAGTRIEYLSLLVGRPAPGHPDEWREASIDKIVAFVDGVKATPAWVDALRGRVDAQIKHAGVPLSAADFATIDRFHRAFIDAGLSLKFQSWGRLPRSYYPTYRELLLETDRNGRQLNYLTSEDDFQFVRSLQARDLVIPVVGDLAGSRAMAAVGRFLTGRGERLSAIYTSNVEMYLFRDLKLPRFVENVKRLPRNERSVIIRAIFGDAFGATLPESVPGYYSTSVIQPVEDLIGGFSSGKYRTYWDLVTAGSRGLGQNATPAAPAPVR